MTLAALGLRPRRAQRDGFSSESGSAEAERACRPSVLIFDGYYASLGGNQRYIAMLLAAGRTARWHVALACAGEGPLAAAGRAAGGPVHVVRQSAWLERGRDAILRGGPLSKIRTAFALLGYNLRLLPLLRRLRPDVLQCHSTRNALMAGLAARLAGVPMVLFVKGALDTPLFDRIAVGLARRTIFISAALEPAWHRPSGSPIAGDESVVRIGIEFDDVDAAERRAAVAPPAGVAPEPGTVSFVFAGWLTPDKGVHVLIEAFGHAAARRPDCRLLVVGTSNDQAYVQRLHALADRCAPPGTIRFLGWRDDVLDVLAAADAFVLPSFSEGVPRSIVESMALGKAVIATAVGGVPELLGNGAAGLVVEPGDTVALADAIVRLAADRPLRLALGQRGRDMARGRYSFEAHLRRLWQVLDSARRPSAIRGAFDANCRNP